MTETSLPARFAVAATTPQAVALLPALGRVLVGLSAGGATHERIGIIEAAELADGRIRLGGPAHAASLDAQAVTRIVADRTSTMRGKTYPRLELRGAEDALLLSITSMDGPEAFDAALADWIGAAEEPTPRSGPTPSEAFQGTDPGTKLLEALRDGGGEIEISLAIGPARQAWRGRIEEVKPAMGFANIIRPDFHLHLREGSLGTLRVAGDTWNALGPDQTPIGLAFHPLDDAARAALTGL